MPYLDILRVFLRLGLTSFGGPVAHIGYFREEFVARRAWVSDSQFAHWLAISQAMPGPASSQMGFLIGLHRGGLVGALIAWAGFTLPSALALVLVALYGLAHQAGWFELIVDGLKLVAVAVVAQAVIGMFRSLCTDTVTRVLSVVGFGLALGLGGWAGQVGAIAAGGIAGWFVCQRPGESADGSAASRLAPDHSPTRLTGALMLMALAVLLFVVPWFAAHTPMLQMFDAFFRAGALVFGGGHVVLPLLESATVTPGLVSSEDFLTGYGLAQAVPGPLFTFAAWLGALDPTWPGWSGAVLALVAIFVPGLVLIVGVLPWWQSFGRRPKAFGMLAGINASVVGVLAAAWVDPVLMTSVSSVIYGLIALFGAALLLWRKLPVWCVVLILPALTLLGDKFQL
jgi:chromate transporter